MSTEMNCIFCKIINGESPGSFIYQDEEVVAFMDIRPVNAGHVLVVPRQHIAAAGDLPHTLAAKLMNTCLQVSKALQKAEGIRCEGVNYIMAEGEAAGQEVFHAHMHVFPRYINDGFGFRFRNEYYNLPARQELEKVAAELKNQINNK
jgi:histidine triad (HIT) family protein